MVKSKIKQTDKIASIGCSVCCFLLAQKDVLKGRVLNSAYHVAVLRDGWVKALLVALSLGGHRAGSLSQSR